MEIEITEYTSVKRKVNVEFPYYSCTVNDDGDMFWYKATSPDDCVEYVAFITGRVSIGTAPVQWAFTRDTCQIAEDIFNEEVEAVLEKLLPLIK